VKFDVRTKVAIIGELRLSDDEGLIIAHQKGLPDVIYPNARNSPELMARFFKEKEPTGEAWKQVVAAHGKTLYSDAGYKAAAQVFIDRQFRKPEALGNNQWLYRNKHLLVQSGEPLDPNTEVMLIKHFVLRRERQYERIRREVEALENMEKLQTVSREPIPDSVRLFVWQRDKGQCVKCGSRERLEFDHIIPVSADGSNTERNVQLLCETCNRSKGSTI
jgi:hypothetical protein